ncbi:Gamma-glutamylputrescine oxidoreductase [Hyphodiscus hymeniophilus]|uniref:Gamma-glutamylputrescine oxidoreductase n=1 Tax=Hyphodiscus hymeniophilus TaxID=353542 RepID=A0A9P6VHM3_9HELO|nr:Gamma-glutamylputrescine oxidoreductase [Hyphodiscus hymeniophilus]
MAEPFFPSKESTLPFWRTEPHELDTHRSTPELPKTCDILIIGAGYAGITSAYHILKSLEGKGSSPNIVLVEARQACSGATGRNGGHLRPAVYSLLPEYIRNYGISAAAEVAAFEDTHVRTIADLVAEEKIDCDFTLTKSFDVHSNVEKAKAAKQAYDELKANGVAKSTIDGLIWTDADRAEECGEQGAEPANQHAGYLTVSQFRSVDRHNGKRGKIHPARGICSRIVVPPGSKHPPLTSSYGLRPEGVGLDYLIPRNDGSIIVGGARSRFRTHREQWHSVTDDSTLITPAENYFDGYMQRNFLGWEDSGATVDRVWTGIMGYNSDSLPSVGEVPGREGCFVIAGFEGHGMPVVYLTAKGVAQMVGDGVAYEDAGIPLVYKTTKERLESDRDDYA